MRFEYTRPSHAEYTDAITPKQILGSLFIIQTDNNFLFLKV